MLEIGLGLLHQDETMFFNHKSRLTHRKIPPSITDLNSDSLISGHLIKLDIPLISRLMGQI